MHSYVGATEGRYPLIMDHESLKPYLDAVKAARVARHAVSRMADSGQALAADLLRADEAYQQACEELASFTNSCTET